jgi:hypothetical protein
MVGMEIATSVTLGTGRVGMGGMDGMGIAT